MNLFASLQTETYKDVKINSELTEEQKGEIIKVWKNLRMFFFADIPGLTNLETILLY